MRYFPGQLDLVFEFAKNLACLLFYSSSPLSFERHLTPAYVSKVRTTYLAAPGRHDHCSLAQCLLYSSTAGSGILAIFRCTGQVPLGDLFPQCLIILYMSANAVCYILESTVPS